MLDDWTNEGFDPFASPTETGSAFGSKHGDNSEAITRHRVAAQRMVGVPGDEQIRTDESGFPINRHFPDVPQDEPDVMPEPGFEGEVASFSLFAYLSRSDVTWNPSVVSGVQGQPRTARPRRSTSCRSSTATTGSSGSSSSPTRSGGTSRTATPGSQANIVMKAGDVASMPADIRHQGYAPKRSMLLVWENAARICPSSRPAASCHRFPSSS